MIHYEEALTILHKAERMEKITLAVQDACGYIAAAQILSDVQVPPFANSAMDGFAVCSSDLADASDDNPVVLPIMGSSAAGDRPAVGEALINKKGAWEIMTGAPVPEVYDAVVKIEDVQVKNHTAQFRSPVLPENNIRKAGEDIFIADEIVQSGTLLNPYHVMSLATIGQKDIRVYNKPGISVFSTGKELVEDVTAPLLPGQIRNSNGPYLMSTLQAQGYAPHYGGMIADDPEQFETCLQKQLSKSDIIISTGAVSAGKHDFIPDSLRKLGADILFHKVAIRPGKPVLYGRFPDGTHYFGLPGNPVSAAVGLRFFVTPLLRCLQGREPETPISARLLTPFAKKKGFRFFRKAYASVSPGGEFQLDILPGQESFKIQPLLKANCWASFSKDQDGTEVGTAIPVYPLTPGKWMLEAAL